MKKVDRRGWHAVVVFKNYIFFVVIPSDAFYKWKTMPQELFSKLRNREQCWQILFEMKYGSFWFGIRLWVSSKFIQPSSNAVVREMKSNTNEHRIIFNLENIGVYVWGVVLEVLESLLVGVFVDFWSLTRFALLMEKNIWWILFSGIYVWLFL